VPACVHGGLTTQVFSLFGRKTRGNLAMGGWIEKISVMHGKCVRVAKLPPFTCASPTAGDGDSEAEPTRLGVQDPMGFVVDESGRNACLTLMDRNINMADVIVRREIELGSSKVSRGWRWEINSAYAPKLLGASDRS